MEIYNYSNYRKFLRQTILTQPRKGWGVISRLAEFLGVNQVVVSQILAGKRDLSLDQAYQIGRFWELSSSELDYFILMVTAERAASNDLKQYTLAKMQKHREEMRSIHKQIPADQELSEAQKSVFYSSWLYSAVRLHCDIALGKSAEEVAQHFQISRSRSADILKFLLESGLCSQENGRYRLGSQRTAIQFGSPYLVRHHTNWRVRAIEHTEKIEPDEMMITSPVSVSREDFEIIRAELLAVLKSISTRVRVSTSEEVACLNIDWFRVR